NGEGKNTDEGAARPDIEEGDAEEGPGPRAEGAVDAELQRAHEGSVGGGDGRTQGPVPPDHAHARGIRPGEEHGQEYEGPTSEGAGEEEGEAEPQGELCRARDDGVHERDGRRAPELGVRELPAIVLQPHEGRASVLERGE